MSRYVLGAYAAAPSDLSAHQRDEREWFAALASIPLVGGLELPFDGGLHPSGPKYLAGLLDPSWRSVVTAMSGVSTRLLTDPSYGLASTNEASRMQAISDIAAARSDIVRVRSIRGKDSIIALQLQSAPGARNSRASADALALSLVEILGWDWDGVAISVEHCDAPNENHAPQKGFLSLSEEMIAVNTARERTGAAIGHTINWARSTIESRDPATPAAQTKTLSNGGSLVGLMFSGVAASATAFGPAWADAHLPVSDAGDGSETHSLLSSDQMVRSLRATGGTELYVGAKVSAPKVELPLLDRLKPGVATLRALAETDRK
jgi:hypothetical protein